VSDRDKKLLLVIPVAILILIVRFGFMRDDPKVVGTTASESIPQTEKHLAQLRGVAATVPGKQKVLALVDADLAAREKGIIQVETAPQAQARLLELIRRVANPEGIDIRGGDFGQPKVIGDYGEVNVGVTFTCPIEKFVNFMAGLSREPELIGPSDIRMTAQNPKDKTVTVRMILGGLVPRKLVPEKKGFSAL
jgi:hypothetical protein